MQNKANVELGRKSIRIAAIKDYGNEQWTTNNERYSKQTQNKANLSLPKGEQSLSWPRHRWAQSNGPISEQLTRFKNKLRNELLLQFIVVDDKI